MQHRSRFGRGTRWLVALSVILLPFGSWCLGLWGQDTTRWQGIFECLCPGFTASIRYRPFKVLSPACNSPSFVNISPSGRYVAISEGSPSQTVVWDLATGQRQELPSMSGEKAFVSETVFIIGGRERATLFDLSDGSRIEMPSVEYSPEQGLPEPVLETLRQAERVIRVNMRKQLVALASDYRRPDAGNLYIFITQDRIKPDLLEAVTSAGIQYETLPTVGKQREDINLPEWEEFNPLPVVRSRGGTLLAGQEGIYAADTLELLVRTGYIPDPDTRDFEVILQVHGWALNDRSVVYSRFSLGSELWGTDAAQPILLLELPSQYWAEPLTTATPEP